MYYKYYLRGLLLLFSIAISSINCNSNEDIHDCTEFLVRDAFFQAITLEKIDSFNLITNKDSLLVFPCSIKEDSTFSYNVELAEKLPIHVDNWYIKTIDESFIKKHSVDSELNYLIFYLESDKKRIIAQFIIDTELPPAQKELLLIDRARLSIVFKLYGTIWRIINILNWYG